MTSSSGEAPVRLGGRSLGEWLIRVADLAFAAAAMLLFTGIGFPLLLLRGRLGRRSSPRRILHLVNGSIDATKGRNGLYYYGSQGLLGDLDGYFERVTTVFFLTRRFRVEQVSERTRLIDFNADRIGFLEPMGFKATRVVLDEFLCLTFLTRLVVQERVGVVQVVDPYISGVNGWILSFLTGARFVVLVMSDYDVHCRLSGRPIYACLRSRRLEKFIEKRVFHRADLVLADRLYYARSAIDNGCDQRRVRAFPATVHEDFYLEPKEARAARRHFGFEEDDSILLYVGRLSPEKHVLDLPEVLAAVSAAVPGTKLLVAGDGVLREEFLRRSLGLGIREENLLLPGALDIERLRMAYASADIVLGTHMGFTLLEAALSGKPIVAYDWEWHPEIIESGRTGVLVPFRDHGAMAAVAIGMLDDPEPARDLGREARRTALERHALGRNVERLREAYVGLEV